MDLPRIVPSRNNRVQTTEDAGFFFPEKTNRRNGSQVPVTHSVQPIQTSNRDYGRNIQQNQEDYATTRRTENSNSGNRIVTAQNNE